MNNLDYDKIIYFIENDILKRRLINNSRLMQGGSEKLINDISKNLKLFDGTEIQNDFEENFSKLKNNISNSNIIIFIIFILYILIAFHKGHIILETFDNIARRKNLQPIDIVNKLTKTINFILNYKFTNIFIFVAWLKYSSDNKIIYKKDKNIDFEKIPNNIYLSISELLYYNLYNNNFFFDWLFSIIHFYKIKNAYYYINYGILNYIVKNNIKMSNYIEYKETIFILITIFIFLISNIMILMWVIILIGIFCIIITIILENKFTINSTFKLFKEVCGGFYYLINYSNIFKGLLNRIKGGNINNINNINNILNGGMISSNNPIIYFFTLVLQSFKSFIESIGNSLYSLFNGSGIKEIEKIDEISNEELINLYVLTKQTELIKTDYINKFIFNKETGLIEYNNTQTKLIISIADINSFNNNHIFMILDKGTIIFDMNNNILENDENNITFIDNKPIHIALVSAYIFSKENVPSLLLYEDECSKIFGSYSENSCFKHIYYTLGKSGINILNNLKQEITLENLEKQLLNLEPHIQYNILKNMNWILKVTNSNKKYLLSVDEWIDQLKTEKQKDLYIRYFKSNLHIKKIINKIINKLNLNNKLLNATIVINKHDKIIQKRKRIIN